MHSWFIRSLFWPSTQCISTTTSLSSSITFSRHLNRKCSTALGLSGRFEGGSLASVQVEDSTSSSFCSPLVLCVTSTLEEAPLLSSAVLSSLFSSRVFCVDDSGFWEVGFAALAAVVWELVAAQWGALGNSRNWRFCSRRFCRPWIHVFSTAVRKRLCSCFLPGTRLCSTCRATQTETVSYSGNWRCDHSLYFYTQWDTGDGEFRHKINAAFVKLLMFLMDFVRDIRELMTQLWQLLWLWFISWLHCIILKVIPHMGKTKCTLVAYLVHLLLRLELSPCDWLIQDAF